MISTKKHKQYKTGYSLSLSDGNSWWIAGEGDSIKWVDKLAHIMELEASPPDFPSQLILSRTINESENAKPAEHDHESISVKCHQSDGRTLCKVFATLKAGEVDLEIYEYLTMWNSLRPIYQSSIAKGGLPFHAGFAELDGRGILFAAPGDTGKSTCCNRLPDYWKPLCDDECLVVLSDQGEYRVHPFPTWSDYLWRRSENTWNVQYSVPLSGLFFLEQSKTDEVIHLGSGEAAVLISESASQVCGKHWRRMEPEQKREQIRAIFDNACKIAAKIPAFRLCATLHGEFWREIENVVK